MKKVLVLAAAFMLIYSFGNSQTLISGKVGFKYSNTNNLGNKSELSNIHVNPLIGGHISENFAVGADFSASYIESEINSNMPSYYSSNKIDAKQFYFGVFARLYSPVSEKLRFVFHLSNGLIEGEGDIVESQNFNGSIYDSYSYFHEYKSHVSGYQAYLKPGIALGVSKRWDIEVFISNLSYYHLEEKQEKSQRAIYKKDELELSFNDISIGATLKF